MKNLNTIWIGRFHLFANPVRFERPNKPTPSARVDAVPIPKIFKGTDQAKVASRSYVNVASGKSPASVYGHHISPAPVLVLDESCVVEHDLSNHVMGKVKDANVISNLRNFYYGRRRGKYKLMMIDKGSIKVPAQSNSGEVNSRDDELSDIEEVSETVFGNNSPSHAASQESEDPFNIYGILNKSKKGTDNHKTSSSMSHPPGFTPVL
ncbi:hypothetical protein Tco_1132822 [Tanacetum coccineum]|uniref:Uncharacterized protein n=1 Tax=Tanacetum coccineum TaxID=301880 RepID=A0ABQ5JDP2_9ASTR